MPHQVFGAVAGDCIINTCIVLGDESQHQHPLWEPDTDPTRSPRPELPRPSRNIVPHPFPPNRAHPTFEGPSRDEHHYHHHQNRPPVYHQPPRPVLHSHHDHVLNRRRDSHFDAVLEGFMESQRKLAATLRQS
ncbi:unnamed protein product [Microthlaspi erraticum]|uniref:Uncharacterized protein n=1 Tax=Microthlaspi erraticum TaxID=1685480 RepID=A0A6D2IM56_9BRAS|nr:unnamed protein product [Microthlaspi erraticum]